MASRNDILSERSRQTNRSYIFTFYKNVFVKSVVPKRAAPDAASYAEGSGGGIQSFEDLSIAADAVFLT